MISHSILQAIFGLWKYANILNDYPLDNDQNVGATWYNSGRDGNNPNNHRNIILISDPLLHLFPIAQNVNMHGRKVCEFLDTENCHHLNSLTIECEYMFQRSFSGLLSIGFCGFSITSSQNRNISLGIIYSRFHAMSIYIENCHHLNSLTVECDYWQQILHSKCGVRGLHHLYIGEV